MPRGIFDRRKHYHVYASTGTELRGRMDQRRFPRRRDAWSAAQQMAMLSWPDLYWQVRACDCRMSIGGL